MFRYLNKNLKSLFTKQRLLSLLLVINIVVSCLVICFSYGLYQNYNMIVLQGEQEDYSDLGVLIKQEELMPFDEQSDAKFVVDISPTTLMDMIKALSSDSKSNLYKVTGQFIVDSPLSKNDNGDITEDAKNEYGITGNSDLNKYYSDDDEPYYLFCSFGFAMDGDKIVNALDDYDYFTDEEYSSGEKVAVVQEGFYDEQSLISFHLPAFGLDWHYRVLPEGTDSIIIGGEQYKITKILQNGYIPYLGNLLIPMTSIPESARLFAANAGSDDIRRCFTFFFNGPVTREQYEDIQNCLGYLGDDVFLEEIEFTEATEIYYYKTIMLISVVIAVLAAINMAILYRYILEKRSSELAIFRICGCSKIKAISSYLIECMVINIPLFALTQLIYHKLIMPRLTDLFPNIAGAYSFKLYAAIFGIYIGASMLIMLIMIIATIRKHSLVALKSAPKVTSKLSVMKVFEIVQLAAVFSMLMLIVSAILSKYVLFTPFEHYIERRGYLVQSTDGTMYSEKFGDIIGDAEYIMSQTGNMAIGEFGTSNYTNFGGILYSNEFIEAYKPLMEEGVWLSDVDETYESSGYIPTVITSCDGRYKVGDVLEQEYQLDWVDDKPTRIVHAKYRIVGILADKASIASYVMNNSGEALPNKDYRDIYNVFSDSFEDEDYLLRRISDEHACFGSDSVVFGIQFVFCDDMTEEEYEEIGRKLNGKSGFAVAQLSEVYDNSLDYIYEQMYTLFPIAVCIFILTIISTVSISAIYTKRQLRNYAIFYICGARWRTCALKSLKNGAITCAISAVLSALILIIGKATFLSETVISFGLWHFAVCAGVIVLYLALSMIMPLSIIGSSEPREVLKEE